MVAPCTPELREARTRTLDEDEAAVGRRYATPQPGHRIGRYEIHEPIGAGGMGTVYRARDPQLAREVAIKLIRPERASAEQTRARFVREARAMAKITHPNVVEVYDAGIADGRPYVVMELVRGTTLGGWLAAQPRSTAEILQRLVQAGLGLVAAHQAGLIHRDFKPANVLIGDDGRVLVSDFGLARALEEAAPEASAQSETAQASHDGALTQTGTMLGSPVYMAPEQHGGDPDVTVDARADQFAFAVTALEALVGHRPFEGTSTTVLLTAKLSGPPTVPSNTPWLRRHGGHLRRALSPDPAQRWPDMRALLDALASGRDHRRPIAMASAVACVGFVGLAMLPSPQTRCALGGARIETVWSDAQRAAVTTALAASGREHAAATAPRVLAQLDTRTRAWTQTYVEVCAHPGPELDARMACLEAQRTRLQETVATLMDADAPTADRAIAIASAGAMPGQCLESDETLGTIPQAQRAAADEIRDALRRGKQAEHLGDSDQADALTANALRRARDLGHPALLAHALTTRGSALESLERYDEAASLLYEAIEVAEAAGVWRQAAAAQIEAVFLEGYRRDNPQVALRLARQAESALARAGGDPQLEASLLNNVGATYHAMRDTDNACTSMAAALALREKTPSAYSNPIARTIALVSAQENVGACMITAGRDVEALPYLEAALEASRAVFGPNNPELAGLHQALSSALETVGRNAEALEHIDLCIALWESSLPPGDDRLAGAYADRGYALSSAGNLEASVESMLQAAEIAEATRGSEDPSPWVYRANAAEALVDLGQIERAADLAETARRRVLSLLEPGALARVVVQVAAGRAAMAQADPATALQRYLGAVEDSRLVWGGDHVSQVALYTDIAKARRAGDDAAGAVEDLERAVALAAVEPEYEPLHSGEASFELAKAIDATDPVRASELAERAAEIYGRHAEMPDRVATVRAWLAVR